MNQVTVVESDAVVATLSRARAALTEAKSIQETKRIVDAAAAAEIYAKRQKLGEETSDLALSIKIEALRKLGKMLRSTPKSKGAAGQAGPGRGKNAVPIENRVLDAPTLAELGLTKKESAVAQKLAALPDSEFQHVRDGHTTVAKAIAAVDAAKMAPSKPSKRQLDSRPADIAAPSANDEMAEAQHTIAELAAENERLTDRLSVEVMDAGEEEKTLALETIGELRERVKVLEAENEALKASRDALMRESGEKQKQIDYWRKQVGKVAA